MRGFRFRSSLKKFGLRPTNEAPRRMREKNLWYPGYCLVSVDIHLLTDNAVARRL